MVNIRNDVMFHPDAVASVGGDFFTHTMVLDKVELIPSPAFLASLIAELAISVADFREPLTKSVNDVIIPSIRKNFDSGGRPPWAPLAQGTVDQRGSADPILVRSGTRMDDATSPQSWTITATDATMPGITAFYGVYHQEGTYKMPARPFLMLQEQDAIAIEEVFGAWLDEKVAVWGG